MSVDPLVDETDQPYSYVAGDPTGAVDPWGLKPFWKRAWDGTVHVVGGAGQCVQDQISCLSAHGLANAGVAAVNTATSLLSGGSQQAIPLPYPCNPYVSESTAFGQAAVLAAAFAIPGGEGDFADLGALGGAADEAGSVAPDLGNLSPKIERDLLKRGWTPQEIQDAYENGKQVQAVNMANGRAATRYINPTTGKSVVIENGSGQVIHVGGAGFKYGPGSGDLP